MLLYGPPPELSFVSPVSLAPGDATEEGGAPRRAFELVRATGAVAAPITVSSASSAPSPVPVA